MFAQKYVIADFLPLSPSQVWAGGAAVISTALRATAQDDLPLAAAPGFLPIQQLCLLPSG